jgi:hypothetical protein
MTASTFIFDPESTMALAAQEQHHALVHAARECYRLRNEAEDRGDAVRAIDMLELGDVYFGRARALLAEWE